MIPSQQNDLEPWYVKKKKTNTTSLLGQGAKKNAKTSSNPSKFMTKRSISLLFYFLMAFVFALFAGIFITLAFLNFGVENFYVVIYFAISFFCFFVFIFFVITSVGSVSRFLTFKNEDLHALHLGMKYFNGEIQVEEPRTGIPAPQMALYQFIQQVRAYVLEKSFLKQKQERSVEPFLSLTGADPHSLLKRRWNDVVDSLNEFEIYLANDPKGMIEKLIMKSPPQNMDVSQIFRDVAETFDTTWRKKGINIEHAIVTPLKANTNEAVLRRLLVGPWRSCVYFARRGNEVIFSAKSIAGQIIARWECEGMVFPEEFFELVQNSTLDVNDRIEKGIQLVAADPSSPNTLFALISFVTWIDLASAAGCHYEIKQGSDGLIIELKL
jgi:hypothetical protein